MKTRAFLTALIAATFSLNANAVVFCQGTVVRVGVQPDGVVVAFAPNVAPDMVYLCQIGVERHQF